MSHASAPIHEACQNCGTRLNGPFCHHCGQRDFDFHRSFRHVLHEALETWFHIDGSFLRGFYDLLFRPGQMTRDFNEGRRARHVPPLRFYLVISVVFFLLFRPAPIPLEVLGTAAAAASETASGEAEGTRIRTAATGGAFQIDEGDKPAPGTLERKLVDRAEKVANDPNALIQSFYQALPKMLLLCLPIFACWSRLLYRTGPWSYLQHLILAVHLHTFVYLGAMVTSGWTKLVELASPAVASFLPVAALLYGIFYYYATFRRALGTSRGEAIGKGTALAVLYGLTLTVGFAVTGILALFWT